MSETDRVEEKYGDISRILYKPTIKSVNNLVRFNPEEAS